MKDTIIFLQKFLGEYRAELQRAFPFLAGGAGVSLLGMVPAFLQQKLFDTALPTGNLVLMAALLAGLVGVQVGLSALEAGLGWQEAVVLEQGDFRLRSRFLHHLLRLPQRYFDTHSLGRIQKIWEDCGRRTESFQALVFSAGRGLLVLGVYLPVLIGLSPLLAAVRLLSFPAGWLINRWFSRRDRQKEQHLWEIGGRFQNELAESVLGIRTVKAFSAEHSLARKLQRGLLGLRRGSLERRRIQSLWGVLSQLSGQLSTALYLMVAAGALFSGQLSFGRFIAFGILSATGLSALGSLLEAWGRVGRNLNSHLRLDHHLSQSTESIPRASEGLERRGSGIPETFPAALGGEKASDNRGILTGEVEFRNVFFGFRPDTPVLQGVNLTAPPGWRIAVVGPSGSGKSTLINLLLGYYRPDKGQVLLDGLEVGQYAPGTLRQVLGLVLQENYFFQKSLRENLLLGRRRTESEIVEALRQAQALDFVHRLPGRLDAVFGDEGLGLSGGQKQRLAIARAFLQNPQVLVLDEPTSALDPAGEKAVQRALEALTVGRTSLTIAHRLGTVVHSDRIYCLDNGRIAGQGTHQELMDLCPLYRDLWTSQRGKV